MSHSIDYTSPSAQFAFNLNNSPLFIKDQQNYINIMGVQQLNTLQNTSLLDIFLSSGNVVEPHYHQNAAELVYCICGAAVVSMLNPFTKEILNFSITPGKVANVPQGWWHYETAMEDNTHLLAIFDADTPEVILGSDILHFTPANVMAHTYCMDEKMWEKTTAPVQPSTYIGPYAGCENSQMMPYQQHNYHQSYQPYPYYY
ncbi:cupin domain-containing protein [Virgibacillus flavescens]|uniref:cupin domain-containing protein n=1 Tax=Virgibacillus flavescens TaxID=1611422 RepID=UPI003D351D0A